MYELDTKKLKPQKGFSKNLVEALGETDIGSEKSIERAKKLATK